MEPGMIEQPEQDISPLDEPTPCPECSENECQCPETPLEALQGIASWLKAKLQYGPIETKGHADPSGHPHFWAAVLIPDWEMRQKLSAVTSIIQIAKQDRSICRECGKKACECEETYGTEAHSDKLERNARDRANAGDWEGEARDDA